MRGEGGRGRLLRPRLRARRDGRERDVCEAPGEGLGLRPAGGVEVRVEPAALDEPGGVLGRLAVAGEVERHEASRGDVQRRPQSDRGPTGVQIERCGHVDVLTSLPLLHPGGAVGEVEGADDGREVAAEDARERVVLVVAVEAVVRDAALREVVGPDLGRAVARADELLARLGALVVDAVALELVEAAAEHAERLVLVLELALLVLDRDDEARRDVREADGRVGRVDGLAARARTRGRRRRGRPACAARRRPPRPRAARRRSRPTCGCGPGSRSPGTRWTRCTPDSNFIVPKTPSGCAAALEAERDLAEAAHAACAGVHRLEAPAVRRGPLLVELVEVAGEQRRLVAAGPGADLDDDVAGVLGVARDERLLEVALGGGAGPPPSRRPRARRARPSRRRRRRSSRAGRRPPSPSARQRAAACTAGSRPESSRPRRAISLRSLATSGEARAAETRA